MRKTGLVIDAYFSGSSELEWLNSLRLAARVGPAGRDRRGSGLAGLVGAHPIAKAPVVNQNSVADPSAAL
jgi:hypothetical protein